MRTGVASPTYSSRSGSERSAEAGVLALHDSEIDLDACDPDRLGAYVCTSVGNIDLIMSLKERVTDFSRVPPHAAFHCFNHSAACVLSSFFNIRGPVHDRDPEEALQECSDGVRELNPQNYPPCTRPLRTASAHPVPRSRDARGRRYPPRSAAWSSGCTERSTQCPA